MKQINTYSINENLALMKRFDDMVNSIGFRFTLYKYGWLSLISVEFVTNQTEMRESQCK